jgi:hypothetical protein
MLRSDVESEECMRKSLVEALSNERRLRVAEREALSEELGVHEIRMKAMEFDLIPLDDQLEPDNSVGEIAMKDSVASEVSLDSCSDVSENMEIGAVIETEASSSLDQLPVELELKLCRQQCELEKQVSTECASEIKGLKSRIELLEDVVSKERELKEDASRRVDSLELKNRILAEVSKEAEMQCLGWKRKHEELELCQTGLARATSLEQAMLESEHASLLASHSELQGEIERLVTRCESTERSLADLHRDRIAQQQEMMDKLENSFMEREQLVQHLREVRQVYYAKEDFLTETLYSTQLPQLLSESSSTPVVANVEQVDGEMQTLEDLYLRDIEETNLSLQDELLLKEIEVTKLREMVNQMKEDSSHDWDTKFMIEEAVRAESSAWEEKLEEWIEEKQKLDDSLEELSRKLLTEVSKKEQAEGALETEKASWERDFAAINQARLDAEQRLTEQRNQKPSEQEVRGIIEAAVARAAGQHNQQLEALAQEKETLQEQFSKQLEALAQEKETLQEQFSKQLEALAQEKESLQEQLLKVSVLSPTSSESVRSQEDFSTQTEPLPDNAETPSGQKIAELSALLAEMSLEKDELLQAIHLIESNEGFHARINTVREETAQLWREKLHAAASEIAVLEREQSEKEEQMQLHIKEAVECVEEACRRQVHTLCREVAALEQARDDAQAEHQHGLPAKEFEARLKEAVASESHTWRQRVQTLSRNLADCEAERDMLLQVITKMQESMAKSRKENAQLEIDYASLIRRNSELLLQASQSPLHS